MSTLKWIIGVLVVLILGAIVFGENSKAQTHYSNGIVEKVILTTSKGCTITQVYEEGIFTNKYYVYQCPSMPTSGIQYNCGKNCNRKVFVEGDLPPAKEQK